MPAHNILVVVVDGLRASVLGAYGNTTFPTPALDRFAAESFLLDSCYAASVELADVYQSLWRPTAKSLAQQLRSLGYLTTLVADEPALETFPAAADFENHLQIDQQQNGATALARATDTANTSMARLFATAAEVVSSAPTSSPNFIWLHSRGMYGRWDAPIDLQLSLLDENDPPPVEDVVPPDFVIGAADDPDAAFRYGCAYAAQAMVLDECWESLASAVDLAGSAGRWLVTLLGARGYPLGEHRRIGGVDPRLYGEQLHVPWLIRFPDGAGQLARSNKLTTHLDLAPSLMDPADGTCVRALAGAPRPAWRDALIATSPAVHRAIRTAEWCLRQNAATRPEDTASATADASSPSVEVFVRPDDRWEANDVAKLCPDVVEMLLRQLDESTQSSRFLAVNESDASV